MDGRVKEGRCGSGARLAGAGFRPSGALPTAVQSQERRARIPAGNARRDRGVVHHVQPGREARHLAEAEAGRAVQAVDAVSDDVHGSLWSDAHDQALNHIGRIQVAGGIGSEAVGTAEQRSADKHLGRSGAAVWADGNAHQGAEVGVAHEGVRADESEAVRADWERRVWRHRVGGAHEQRALCPDGGHAGVVDPEDAAADGVCGEQAALRVEDHVIRQGVVRQRGEECGRAAGGNSPDTVLAWIGWLGRDGGVEVVARAHRQAGDERGHLGVLGLRAIGCDPPDFARGRHAEVGVACRVHRQTFRQARRDQRREHGRPRNSGAVEALAGWGIMDDDRACGRGNRDAEGRPVREVRRGFDAIARSRRTGELQGDGGPVVLPGRCQHDGDRRFDRERVLEACSQGQPSGQGLDESRGSLRAARPEESPQDRARRGKTARCSGWCSHDLVSRSLSSGWGTPPSLLSRVSHWLGSRRLPPACYSISGGRFQEIRDH